MLSWKGPGFVGLAFLSGARRPMSADANRILKKGPAGNRPAQDCGAGGLARAGPQCSGDSPKSTVLTRVERSPHEQSSPAHKRSRPDEGERPVRLSNSKTTSSGYTLHLASPFSKSRKVIRSKSDSIILDRPLRGAVFSRVDIERRSRSLSLQLGSKPALHYWPLVFCFRRLLLRMSLGAPFSKVFGAAIPGRNSRRKSAIPVSSEKIFCSRADRTLGQRTGKERLGACSLRSILGGSWTRRSSARRRFARCCFEPLHEPGRRMPI